MNISLTTFSSTLKVMSVKSNTNADSVFFFCLSLTLILWVQLINSEYTKIERYIGTYCTFLIEQITDYTSSDKLSSFSSQNLM